MNALIEQYLAYLAGVRNLSGRTVESYRRDLQLFDNFFEGTPLSADSARIKLFTAHLAENGYAASSINRILAAVRGFFRFAVRFGHAAENPALTVTNLKTGKPLPDFLFDSEMRILCDLPGNLDILWPARDTALFLVLYSTGCRVSELAGLCLKDIESGSTAALVMGKGGKERRVFFSPLAKKALSEYLVERSTRLASQKGVDRTKGRVFVSARLAALSVRGIQYILSRYSGPAGTGRPVSPHAVRHSFATALVSRGADIRIVQELLGHSNVSTTQRYTHITGEQIKEIYHRSHPHG